MLSLAAVSKLNIFKKDEIIKKVLLKVSFLDKVNNLLKLCISFHQNNSWNEIKLKFMNTVAYLVYDNGFLV